jgi:hypothetical protein
MKQYVKDLENWPPQVCTAFLPRGSAFPSSLDEAIAKGVMRNGKTSFEFICTAAGADFNYPFSERDVGTAEKLWTIFENSLGKSLLSIGMLEVPAD